MNANTQEMAIFVHLKRKKGKGITPIEALEHYGCFRLGARIYDLRKKGHDIQTIREESPDGQRHWARYVLIKEAWAA